MTEHQQFDHLNAQAREALHLAQAEASRFGHPYIGTEHLLLGLVSQEGSLAAQVLEHLGVSLARVRQAVEFIIGRGDRIVVGEVRLMPRAKKVLALAVEEARQLKQETVGPEHLLLGLVAEGEGIASGVLESLGVGLGKVRGEIRRWLRLPIEPGSDQPPFAPGTLGHVVQKVEWAFAPGKQSFQPLIGPGGMQVFEQFRTAHLWAAQPTKTAIGAWATQAPPGGTLLGSVAIGTGGDYRLTLYDGLAEDALVITVITNPPAGASFPFFVLLEHGLTYRLEGTPGSLSVLYRDVPVSGTFLQPDRAV